MNMTRTQAIALAAAIALSPLSLMPAAMSDRTIAVSYAAPDTINLTDVTDIDSLPVCDVEDCSDQVGQVGVWYSKSTGAWLLERGEDYTRVIVDNTVTGGTYLGPDTVGSSPADDAIYAKGYIN